MFFVAVLLMVFYSATLNAETISFQIELPPKSGKMVALLFDSSKTFPKKPFQTKTFSVVEDNYYKITDVPVGYYVLMVYEDRNENGKLDKNFIGIPKEPIGFSNNYTPKGPPRYKKAEFLLEKNQDLHFTIYLKQVLGKRGRLGVGVGIISQRQPYKGSNKSSVFPIPAISYIGKKIQIFGTRVQVGLMNWESLRLAWTGRLRIRAYKEEDSPILEGLGNRRTTFLMGPAMKWEGPYEMNFSAAYQQDVLNQIGGAVADFSLEKGFSLGAIELSPSWNVSLLTEKFSQHDFGVSTDQARNDRPAYLLNNTWNWGMGFSIFWRGSERWSWGTYSKLEFLDSSISDSPIVDESILISNFSILTYLF